MGQRILFFDGVCNLCNSFVDFVIRRDTRGLIQFASLQGETAKSKLPENVRNSLTTVVLLESGQTYYQSDAVIQTFSHLPRPWCWFSLFRILPRSFRDWAYRVVARRRYLIWGQRDTCRVPLPYEKARFLD